MIPGEREVPLRFPEPGNPQLTKTGQQEFLCRGGSFSNANFTPRPGNDTDKWPIDGLSLYDNHLYEACNKKPEGTPRYSAVPLCNSSRTRSSRPTRPTPRTSS